MLENLSLSWAFFFKAHHIKEVWAIFDLLIIIVIIIFFCYFLFVQPFGRLWTGKCLPDCGPQHWNLIGFNQSQNDYNLKVEHWMLNHMPLDCCIPPLKWLSEPSW